MNKSIMIIALLAIGCLQCIAQENKFPEAEITNQQADKMVFDQQLATVFYLHDVVYATKDGVDLHLQMLMPNTGQMGKKPCVLYVQGSAWMKQNVYMNVAQLAEFAKRGYVVAIVEYRHTGIAPFPAQMQDAKTAIRYIRMNAEKYHIDANNLFIWGDSSGGHTALMVGLTQGQSDMDDDMYGDVSADVNAVIAYYPPTEIYVMRNYPSKFPHEAPNSPEGLLIGGKTVSENQALAEKASPLHYVTKERKLVPMFIAAGTMDSTVPFSQSDLMANKLQECNQSYEFHALMGADHGSWEFWTPRMFDLVEAFIKKNTRITVKP